MINIPSAVTLAEELELRTLAAGRDVLEVGALLGHSTVALAQTANHVVSVDPHEDYPANNPRPTLPTFLSNLDRHGVRDKVTPIVARHNQAFPRLAPRSFDVVFIDCTGEYQLTLSIMRAAVPLLRPHATMCVHDCGHPDWPGAMEAVETFGRPFRLIDRLAVIEGMWSSPASRKARLIGVGSTRIGLAQVAA
jgi:predicted O-methyltransferase YrrM